MTCPVEVTRVRRWPARPSCFQKPAGTCFCSRQPAEKPPSNGTGHPRTPCGIAALPKQLPRGLGVVGRLGPPGAERGPAGAAADEQLCAQRAQSTANHPRPSVPPYRPTSAPPEASPSGALNREPPRTPATGSAGPPLTRCSREETLCFCSLEGSRRERAWLAGDQSRRGTMRPPTPQIPPHARLHALHTHVRPSPGCALHGGSKGYRRRAAARRPSAGDTTAGAGGRGTAASGRSPVGPPS